jgi:hypothetical protein
MTATDAVKAAIKAQGGSIIREKDHEGNTRLDVGNVNMNVLYGLRDSFEAVTYVGVRGPRLIVDIE